MQPLLGQDGVFTIPQGHAEAQQLLIVADPGKAILAPVVGTGPGLVMSEVVPGISILAVVLANRSPLPLAQVGSHFLHGVLAVRASSNLADSGSWDIPFLLFAWQIHANGHSCLIGISSSCTEAAHP